MKTETLNYNHLIFYVNVFDFTESSEPENLGKCSHGGPRGTSGTSSTVTGGINKDTLNPTYSPHFTLHKTAAKAAIEHTKYFFVDPCKYNFIFKTNLRKF